MMLSRIKELFGYAGKLRVIKSLSVLFVIAPPPAIAQEITAARPDAMMAFQLGDAWDIFINGEIKADAGARLEQFIVANKIPGRSMVILNSPGGSLAGGMALGRVFRKYDLRTDVGVQKAGERNHIPGSCFSSCTLAYVGGTFRFLTRGSKFGVHRFAFTTPQQREADMAQMASASIIGYLREMDVDIDLFKLSTTAAPEEIYEPTQEILERMGIVTNGLGKSVWTIEGTRGVLYLKGQRNTIYGINKFILACPPERHVRLFIIFDTQRREHEVMNLLNAHSLVIDGKGYHIKAARKEIINGWYNGEYELTREQVQHINDGKSVGIMLQFSYESPVFLGFDSMPTREGVEKISAFLNSCR